MKQTYLFSVPLKDKNGFTLVELVVVIAMIGVLMLGLIFTLNPITQFNKAKDSQREHDLEQIKQALDIYYNDTKCYPTSLSSLGSSYIQKLPTDPSGGTYVYQTDGTNCSQWNVLYAKLATTPPTNACPLSSSCVPKDYVSSGYNFCKISGNVDCTIIAGSTVFPSPTSSPGGGPGGGGAAPTPTPYTITCTGNYYACTGNNLCNVEGSASSCYGHGGTLQCYCSSNCGGACK